MKILETARDRDVLFGRLLAILDVVGEKVLPKNESKIEWRFHDKFIKRPASTFKEMYEELMIYNGEFGQTEWDLLHLLDQIVDELSEDRFNDDPLESKYVWGLGKQRHVLHNVGIDDETKSIIPYN